MLMSKRNQKGFSLIEVLIVVVILGILSAISIPRYLDIKAQSKKNVCRTNLTTINDVLEEYHAINGFWANQLTDITEDTARFPDGQPACPDGGIYSINDSTNRVQCSLAASEGHHL
jgi:prepilin-type N-terminal cleavage/methylation domain-containing protein